MTNISVRSKTGMSSEGRLKDDASSFEKKESTKISIKCNEGSSKCEEEEPKLKKKQKKRKKSRRISKMMNDLLKKKKSRRPSKMRLSPKEEEEQPSAQEMKSFNKIVIIEEVSPKLEESNVFKKPEKKNENKEEKENKKEEKEVKNSPKKSITGSRKIIRSGAKKGTFVSNEREFTKKRRLRRLKSTVSLVSYFNEDCRDTDKLMQLKDPYFYHEHIVIFSLSQYIEFFFLHILGYFTVGPLVNLYSMVCWGNRYLMYNLQFLRNTWVCYLQYSYCSVALWVYYMCLCNPSPIGDFNCLNAAVLQYLMRASSIAGKYATYPKNFIKKIREKKVAINELNQELMLRGWKDQSGAIMTLEIDSTFKRQEIDDPRFKIAFLTEISEKLKNELMEILSSHPGDYCQGKNKQRKCVRKMIMYFDAKILFEYLLTTFNKKYSNPGFLVSLYTNSNVLLLTFAPNIIRFYFKQPIIGSSPLEIGFFIFNTLSMLTMSKGFFFFFDNSIADMRRRAWLLEQLGHIISPKRSEVVSTVKLLPTINLVDQVSLDSWISFRKLCIDYGKKYYKRHEVFLPMVFIAAMVYGFKFALLFFFQMPFADKFEIEIKKTMVFSAMHFTILIIMFFNLLFKAAAINDQFEAHIDILKKNKQVYKDLLFYKEFYFAEFLDRADAQKMRMRAMTYDICSLKDRKSQSFVHRRLAREVKDILGMDTMGYVDEYLSNILAVNDSCIEQLEDEQRFNALKILGFTVTTSVVFNLMFALISVALTCYEILPK